MTINTYHLLSNRLSAGRVKRLIRGKVLLDESHYGEVILGAGTWLKPEGGVGLVLLPGVLSEGACSLALPALRRVADAPGTRYGGLDSGLAGYFDPSGHIHQHRVTAFTRDDVEGWRSMQPLLRELGEAFRGALPE